MALACVLTVNAQENSSYNRISVGYNGLMTSYSGYGMSVSADTYSGLNAQYIHGFSLRESLPAYIETGLGLNWGTGSIETDWEFGSASLDLNILSLYIPVNFA